MHRNKKIKLNDWHLKKKTPMWIAANFECLNVPIESTSANEFMEKLFVDKLIAVEYITV